jgi:hypothetical protein
MDMQHRKFIGLNTSTLSLISLLAACATDAVDLGGSSSVGQNLEVGARCVDSTIVEGEVFVAQQHELDALRGCEAIRGDLTVMVFEGTDLSPLASLRAVSGALLLGATARPIPDEILVNPMGNELAEAFEISEAESARSHEIIEAGWLDSLHGLEALELVGKLTMYGVGAPDLLAFESLRSLSDHPLRNEGGDLWIEQAKNLTDLRGLEGVAGIRSLRLSDNPSLQSLDGIDVSARSGAVALPRVDSVSLQRNPQLTDLTALSNVDSLGSLAIAESALENLDALANVTDITGVTLVGNQRLTNVNGLVNLTFAPDMIFLSNPKLESIPEFRSLAPIERFMVVDNAALRSVSLNFWGPNRTYLDTMRQASDVDNPPTDEPRTIESGSATIEVSDNPQLERLAFGGGMTSALLFQVNRNESLSSIDLGTLRSLNTLSITGNAALSDIALGDIQTVNLISVLANPNLATAGLRSVRTFETVTMGNADDPAE